MKRSGATFTILVGGPITIPGGVSVGDEFRITGRCRVIAITEEQIDVTSLGRAPETMPGETHITLAIKELDSEDNA